MAERNHRPAKPRANGKAAVPAKARRPAARNSNGAPPPAVPVVGIGVCTVSLGSLAQLFAGLEAGLGAAYVVAVRQQEGLTVDSVVKALGRATRMPVTVARDEAKFEADHVYVGGPDDLIAISDGHIRAETAKQPVGHRGTVDTMLISIAEHARERSVAIILAGLGSDGTAGVTATKEYGGLSICESTNGDAEAAAANGAATPAGIVDLLLPPEQIAAQVALYLRSLSADETLGAAAEPTEKVAAQLALIAGILRGVTGNDFHGYKRNTFLRRVQRRMQVLQVLTIEDYVGRLRKNRDEVLHLFQDLLIGVTQFFRDPQEFDALARLLPDLFERAVDDQLRIWVTGCATGEEAYSLAILLREHAATLDEPPHIQIFATDLDARALAIARAGRYASSIAEPIGAERLNRWFVREGDTYCVSKELREMCIFSPHNLIKDAPFSRIDLLSCRNLLIYLDTELQNRIIPIFHFSLRPGGLLFLGSSENVTRHHKLFAPVDRRNRIFRRLETATRILPDFPLGPRGARRIAAEAVPPPPVARPGNLSATIGRRAQQIADRHSPAYVVVDDQHEVLHFSGRTGRYLEPATGAASLNLLNLVHRDLRLDLRGALHKAAEEGKPVEVGGIPMSDHGRPAMVSLAVEPIGDRDSLTAMVVLFQETGPLPDKPARGRGASSGEHVQRLEAELRLTKDRLQATIEELESTNEELKSSNEEYQSINEELQSANEELETSKEELQSVNEELQTVNTELGHRVGDLDRANSDLKNLLESTQIATVFLDNDLRVRNFTPAATDIFHLVETDIGRPISHLAPRIDYGELEEDVRKVVAKLSTIEREVASSDGSQNFMVRILPYRSVDNFIAGAVLTFLDVTGTVQAEAALRASEEQFRRIVENARDYAIFTMDADRKVTDWLAGAESVFGWTAEEMVGRAADITFVPEDRRAGVPEAEIATASREGMAPDVRWHERKDGKQIFIQGSASVLRNEDGSIRGYLKIGQDVTDRKRAEEHERMLLAELQHRVRNTLGVVRSIARRTARNSENVDDMSAHLEGRIDAFARVQAMATRAADGAIDLTSLVEDELLVHAARDGDQVSIKGPDVKLTPKAGEMVSLALHELATNAVKYGALTSDRGRLAISWKVSDSHLELVWQEASTSRVGDPEHEGFGLELLRRVVPYELDAETVIDFRPRGLRFTMSVPLDGTTPDGPPAPPRKRKR